MSLIGDRRNKEVAEKMAKERELAKVSISKEDVDLIVSLHYFSHSGEYIYVWEMKVNIFKLK